MVRISSASLLFYFYIASANAQKNNHDVQRIIRDLQDDASYKPAPSEILGDDGAVEDPTPDYHDYLPLVYVVFGKDGDPHVRAIIEPGDDCPVPLSQHNARAKEKMLSIYDGESQQLKSIATLSNPEKLPYRFPVQLCGLTIDATSEYLEDIKKGDLKLTMNDQTYDVPAVKANPSKFLLLGDTGMRIKPTNLGMGKLGDDNAPDGVDCTAPEVYGIHQCYTNVTKELLTEVPEGSYQSTDGWFFKEIADNAADEDVDVIVYVGDYLYRQGPCPEGAVDTASNTTKECSAVNADSHMEETLESDTILNFVPGHYGDNWWGWWADWFYPAMNMLKTTPIIPTRGNHEICSRGGFGYFMFMFPHDVDSSEEDVCLSKFPPYNVRFENEQFLIMDDSQINPLRGGVDHYMVTPQGCPEAPVDGSRIVPVRENRYLDEKEAEDTREQIELFTDYFQQIEELSAERETNFYVGHRPILGIGCNYTSIVTLDWTLQQSLGPTTLDRISGIITGHMHWLEVLEFEENKLPAQMVVGNGGTMMIENKIKQSSIPFVDLKIGKEEYNLQARVKRGLTMSEFGYGVMERQEDNKSYEVKFNVYNQDAGAMETLDFKLSIPAVRVKADAGQLVGEGQEVTVGVSEGTYSFTSAAKLVSIVTALGTSLLFM